jgi:hypothetical protein
MTANPTRRPPSALTIGLASAEGGRRAKLANGDRQLGTKPVDRPTNGPVLIRSPCRRCTIH